MRNLPNVVNEIEKNSKVLYFIGHLFNLTYMPYKIGQIIIWQGELYRIIRILRPNLAPHLPAIIKVTSHKGYILKIDLTYHDIKLYDPNA